MKTERNATPTRRHTTPPFAPMGVHGKHWLLDTRKLADSFPQKYGMRLHIIGQACDGVDAMDALYDEFPLMIVVTCGVVVLIVGAAFRSLFIPLRSIATIALTIFFVQGLAALVYQYGVWEWTHFEGFASTHAVIYINPLLSFSIIVGVGLDYDIFLLTRIVEYRRIFARLYPEKTPAELTREAITVGLTKTAGIITAAGVIMGIAFSGLLLSHEPIMNQLAFYMVFAVLFDTFVVRPVLVPATMSLLAELNWWPCTFGCPAGAGAASPPTSPLPVSDSADVTPEYTSPRSSSQSGLRSSPSGVSGCDANPTPSPPPH